MKSIGKIILILNFTLLPSAWTQVHYYINFFGHLHQNMTASSSSLTTISCGHPVKVIDVNFKQSGWSKVETAQKTGFIKQKYLSPKRPKCFASKYPKFFNELNLDLSEMYYWGRLYDQYVDGKTKVK